MGTKRPFPFVLAIIALHLSITTPLALILNTWVDESYTLRTTGQTLYHAVHQAIYFELQPPLYFALLQMWRELDHSIFFARLFSVACAALTLYCAAEITRLYVPAIPRAWVVALLAINPALIWAALEIRVYAFTGLLCALLLWSFYHGFLAMRLSRRAQVAHAVIAIAGLYTQYFLGFLLLGFVFALGVTRRWPALRSYLVTLAAVLACTAPLLYLIHGQISTGTASYFSSDSPLYVFLRLNTTCLNYIVPLLWAKPLVMIVHGAKGLAVLEALAAVALVYLSRGGPMKHERATLWAVTITAGAMTVLALSVTREPYGARYAYVFFLPLMFALFATLGALPYRFRWVSVVWSLAFAVFAAGALVTSYDHLAKGGDWKRVAQFIQATEQPGQPILAFQTENALPLEDYYSGVNRVLAVPRPIRFDVSWDKNVVVHSDADIARDLRGVPGQHPVVWAVTTNECRYFNVDYHCLIFEHYVATHFTVLLRREFFGSSVRLLHAKH
ncbi:MAG: hypothetical protein M3Z37_06395 [Candidatus Eremiobacteraeota bacterium]|nr:hypothetical protein [Candidatus Eremiobacteraeota bacterium]